LARHYISTIDLTKSYYQVPLAVKDEEKTTFSSPLGKFQFTRMHFGLKGAPTTFQRMMDSLLGNCHGFPETYIDDVAVYSITWSTHITPKGSKPHS